MALQGTLDQSSGLRTCLHGVSLSESTCIRKPFQQYGHRSLLLRYGFALICHEHKEGACACLQCLPFSGMAQAVKQLQAHHQRRLSHHHSDAQQCPPPRCLRSTPLQSCQPPGALRFAEQPCCARESFRRGDTTAPLPTKYRSGNHSKRKEILTPKQDTSDDPAQYLLGC